MKTLLLSILLIGSAMLLIGFKCEAQSNDADRDWIDSLAVQYRNAYIKSAISSDQADLDTLGMQVDTLIFDLKQDNENCSRQGRDELINSIIQYEDARRALVLRKHVYEREMQLARRNFGS
jgi:hypothetical protein